MIVLSMIRVGFGILLLAVVMVGGGCGSASRDHAQMTAGAWGEGARLWSERVAEVQGPPPAEPMFVRDYADAEFAKPFSRETAFSILLNTEVFAGSAVGYAGTKSNQVEAFQVLMGRRDAVEVFRDLMRRGHRAGQLYALCAFRLTSPVDYAREEPEFLATNEMVNGQWECMVIPRRVCEIVRFKKPDSVPLTAGRNVEPSFELQNADAAPYDISTGSIPKDFRGPP